MTQPVDPQSYDAIDLFAGPGGWDIAARTLGLNVLGVETDEAACETRRAAGLPTLQADVRALDPTYRPAPGLIASPPCQTFSMAGSGSGRRALDTVIDAAAKIAEHGFPELGGLGPRTALILEPLRWVVEARRRGVPYGWVALEQVPTVLPVWEVFTAHLRDIGYFVATGVLSAEQYGVPQTRRHAVLIARRDYPVALPAPTHSRYYPRDPSRLDPGVLPWVSMSDALGWARDVAVRSNYGTRGDPADRRVRIGSQPAWTVTSKVDRNIVFRNGEDPSRSSKVSVQEASTLQTFPADYPWRGTRSQQCQQVGNAIPPLLAEAILREAVKR